MDNNKRQCSTGLSQSMSVLLVYLLGGICGIVFFLIEKQNRFVRVNAAQSVIITAGAFIITVVIAVSSGIFHVLSPTETVDTIFGIIFSIIWVVFSLGFVGLTVLNIYKAMNGEVLKLRHITHNAEKITDVFSSK